MDTTATTVTMGITDTTTQVRAGSTADLTTVDSTAGLAAIAKDKFPHPGSQSSCPDYFYLGTSCAIDSRSERV